MPGQHLERMLVGVEGLFGQHGERPRHPLLAPALEARATALATWNWCFPANSARRRASPSFAILRLNRPKSLNALSWQLVEDLHAALDAVDRDNRCRVPVLTGAGRGFCAGLDLREQGEPGEVVAGLAPGPRAGLMALGTPCCSARRSRGWR